MNGLAIDRFKMLFAAAIDIEQVDEIFPTLLESVKVRRQRSSSSKLFIVVLDLVLKPSQILYSLSFSRREALDQFFPRHTMKFLHPFVLALDDHLTVRR